MSLPVFTVRPEPGASATVAVGFELGLAIEAVPLFAIRPLAWSAPRPEDIDGLLIGSANALRHGAEGLARLRDRPVYAVGEATAAAARLAGFTVAATGEGGLQKLLDTLEPPLKLLRLAGEEHVPLAPLVGVEIVTRVAYRVEPRPLPPEMAERLRRGAVVLLHSGSAARHFAVECDRLAIPRKSVRLATLAVRIAAAAGEGWETVAVAAQPSEPALLALAGELCHDRGDTSRRQGGSAGSEER